MGLCERADVPMSFRDVRASAPGNANTRSKSQLAQCEKKSSALKFVIIQPLSPPTDVAEPAPEDPEDQTSEPEEAEDASVSASSAEEAAVPVLLTEDATEETDLPVQPADDALLALMERSAVLGPLAKQLQAATAPRPRRKTRKLKKKVKGARKKSIHPSKKRRGRRKTVCKQPKKRQ